MNDLAVLSRRYSVFLRSAHGYLQGKLGVIHEGNKTVTGSRHHRLQMNVYRKLSTAAKNVSQTFTVRRSLLANNEADKRAR